MRKLNDRADELFELSMVGGAPERSYRRMRPDIERMPWGTLKLDAEASLAARRSWTIAAFQEHRTAAACTATLEAMIAARVPLDLVALATRFPLDELAHVELCARVAAELGGAVPIMHDAANLMPHPDASLSPLLRACELVVRVFCVGEAISVPLLRDGARMATQPLPKAVLARIVKDEAAHGRFGWLFLDWVLEELDAEERSFLAAAAHDEIGNVERSWSRELAVSPELLETEVRAPLRARGLLGGE